VVDNASDDGSGELAREIAPQADVVSLSRNTGGAGGFAVGIERAVSAHDADYVWVMDDDTVPTATAAEELEVMAKRLPGARLLASRVVWTDGRDHPMNTPRTWRLRSKRVDEALRGVDGFPFRSASFVSLFMPAALVRTLGLPIADYFLWNDDFEYSTRLVRGGVGVYCARSVVEHRTKAFGDTAVDPGERFYFEVRNKIWMFRHSRSLSLPEKGLYGGATLLRWVRTYLNSPGRAVLRSAFTRGVRDGFQAPPRSNAEVLEGFGEASEAIARFEASRG
jgi:rhamnopyranosyl-N-acetylglucosaminyl-diphospho-decaprenol beta-1,3/1,4-galactofuranosyltransferase